MRYALNTVAINGNARLYGASAPAGIVVGATGYSVKQKHGIGKPAGLAYGGAGALKKAKSGRSTALLSFGAAGALRKAATGRALPASIVLAARHGIPSPMPTRASIATPNTERMIVVGADQRVITIPLEDRTIAVMAQPREILVPSETERA